MAEIIIAQEKVTEPAAILELCPFGALEWDGQYLSVSAACKMCKLCVKNGPEGLFQYLADPVRTVDKTQWHGIAVYVDHFAGEIHPVTYELLGKAQELAQKLNYPVYCIFVGYQITGKAQVLLQYGVDEVLVYDEPELEYFRIEPYAACCEDFINKRQPSIVLVGGTTVGRSLAPRVAARFRTGLTADCTMLGIEENSDLAQIRPAFGGNIMAHIFTPYTRPQFATVRYKVFSPPARTENEQGRITVCSLTKEKLASGIKVLEVHAKEKVKSIEEAEVIVVAGRGVKNAKELAMVEELAEKLGGMLAATRPMIEAGYIDPRLQIGLSGRTVKPALLIACGVSGAIQFVAGMDKAEHIIAINTDEHAPIFNVAHYGLVGDLTEIIPQLLASWRGEKDEL